MLLVDRGQAPLSTVNANFAGWAAVAAAVAGLANLIVTTVVTGIRGQTQWARDALTDVISAYLDASWQHTDGVTDRTPNAGADNSEPTGVDSAYSAMRHQLTRLRILASAPLRDAAVDLMQRHRALRDADGPDLSALLTSVSEGRQLLIAAAKRELRLR
jgi:hypothetical protein